jgi:hypothetical protein
MGGTGDSTLVSRAKDQAKAAALPTIVSFVALVAGVPTVLEGFKALGWNITPWSDKADEDALRSLAARVETLEIAMWQRRLKEANAELLVNPNSESAADKKQEAEQQLRRLLRLRRGQ